MRRSQANRKLQPQPPPQLLTGLHDFENYPGKHLKVDSNKSQLQNQFPLLVGLWPTSLWACGLWPSLPMPVALELLERK